jgi:Protein of unknown function (DUF2950)
VEDAPAVALPEGAPVVAAVSAGDREGCNMTNGMRISLGKVLAGFALAVAAVLASPTASAQKSFSSPEAAATAFVDAVASHDTDAIHAILGAEYKRFIPVGYVKSEDITAFLAAWAKQHKIVPEGADRAILAVGPESWTLPIPIAKTADGWRFDVRAGAEEMRTRRIGRNELAAMQAALAYFDAQKEYAERDRNGNGVLEYAQKFVSSPGKRDGLYWPDASGQDESPLGPLYGGRKPGEGYHGYFFRILRAQGKDAPGGAYDYVIGGRMRSGFALVAWPMRYGETGVMSFMVSHDGELYQKDLGPNTNALARAMTRFDPDSTWNKVSL